MKVSRDAVSVSLTYDRPNRFEVDLGAIASNSTALAQAGGPR